MFLSVALRCPQVLNLFDEALEPPIRVAFEAPDADAEEDAHCTILRGDGWSWESNGLNTPKISPKHIWLVVTGTMEFYDFP